MENRFAQAGIWRVRRDGNHVAIEIYSEELHMWIELRVTRAVARTMAALVTEAATEQVILWQPRFA